MFCPFCGKNLEDGAKFCAHCGKQLDEAQTAANATASDVGTSGTAVGTAAKSSMAVKVVSGILVAALAVGLVATSILPRVAYGKNYKFIKAAEKTFGTGKLVDALNSEAIKSGDYTISFSVDADDADLKCDGSIGVNRKEKRYGFNANLSDPADGDAWFYLDKKGMKFVSKEVLGDRVFVYEFGGDNDGYLPDMLEDEGIDLSDFDKLFEESKEDKETAKKLRKASKEVVDSIDFKKSSSESFEIDGKDRKCKGYEAEITGDMVSDWVDLYEEALSDYMDAAEDAAEMTDSYYDPDEMFDELRAACDEMEDIDLKVYLYKGRYAAITVECDDVELSVEFNGGNYPCENMTIKAEDDDAEYEIKKTGNFKGGVETSKVVMREDTDWGSDKYTLYEYEYNTKKGEFEISIPEGDTELSGTLLKKGKGFVLTLSELELDGEDIDLEASVTVKKGATFKKQESGLEECNIGTMSEDDWEDLGEDIEEDLEGFFDEFIW